MPVDQQLPLPAKNFSDNPSLEAAVGNWAQYGVGGGITGSSFTRTLLPGSAWAGNYCWRNTVTANTAGAGAYVDQVADGYWNATKIPNIVPGTEMFSKIRLRTSNANFGYRINIDWFNSSNVLISTDTSGAIYDLVAGDAWQERILSAVAPALAVRAQVVFTQFSKLTGTTGTFDIDAHFFTDVDTVYVDGSMPGCVWDGTAHLSTSRRLAEEAAKVYMPAVIGYGGWQRITAKLFLADKDNNLQDDISAYMDAGIVSANQDAQGSKRSLEAAVSRPDIIIPFQSYLAPYLRVEYADGRVIDDGAGYGMQTGLFATVPPQKFITHSARIGKYDGRDLVWDLGSRSYSATVTVAAGTNVVTDVAAKMAAQGYNRFLIPNEGRVTVEKMSWRPGTSVVTVINDLLASIHYYALRMNRQGFLTSRPYIDFEREEPSGVYYGGNDGAVLEPFETDPVVENIVNHIIVLKDDTDPVKRFRAVRKNSNPASPTNLKPPPVGIGLRSRSVASQNAQTQADVDAEADRLIQEWGSVWVNATFRTFAEPWHDLHEVYELHLTDASGAVIDEADGRFWCKAWKLGFTPESGEMQHDLYRVIPYSSDI